MDDYERIYFVVTSEGANVRSGVGTNYEVIETVNGGSKCIGTFRADVEEDMGMWYQVYLDDEKTETGWISASVVRQEKQE